MKAAIVAAIAAGSLCACQANPNEIAMKVGAPQTGAVELRALQTRRYDSTNSVAVLNAATQTLQDLGFTIEESASSVGVLAASKKRDAEEAGEVAGQIAVTVLGALVGVAHEPVWDTDQVINVTVVESPVPGTSQVDLRVGFDRTVRNTKNFYRAEIIMEPKITASSSTSFRKASFSRRANDEQSIVAIRYRRPGVIACRVPVDAAAGGHAQQEEPG